MIAQAFASFFAQELIADAAILAIFALSLDLLATCGLISFGHAGLLGVGCYVFAGVTVLMGGSPNLAFPAGDRGRRLRRIRGRPVRGAHDRRVLHHGDLGRSRDAVLMGLPQPDVRRRRTAWAACRGSTSPRSASISTIRSVFALTMIVLCIAIWLLLELVVSSPFGRTLAAIRQNPSRVAALGGRVFLYRLAAFTASGAIAALAGALKVQHINFISPDLVSWFVSGDVLIAVVIGGSRNAGRRSARRGAAGPAEGAAVVHIRPLVSLPRHHFRVRGAADAEGDRRKPARSERSKEGARRSVTRRAI